jgi:hypothetical protein
MQKKDQIYYMGPLGLRFYPLPSELWKLFWPSDKKVPGTVQLGWELIKGRAFDDKPSYSLHAFVAAKHVPAFTELSLV